MRRLTALSLLAAAAALAQDSSVRASYHVRQVASGTIYLDGGSEDGLTEGMTLRVFHLQPGEALMNRKEVATVSVMAVAGNSAACEIKESISPIQAGDTAELSRADAEAIEVVRTSKSARKYPQVVSFSEGDPIEEELREFVPKPPLPEVNRIRGRIGFEQDAIIDHAAGIRTLQEGIVLRADMTRIGGTYWNFTGYWRGRISSQSGANTQPTLNDLLNRTYQIGLYYNNPKSPYVMGFGRYLLPWANSLNTMDGGYFGRRFGKHYVVGTFAGSTPDPTAWNYDPNRQVLGTFVAMERGSYETIRWSSTAGAAISRNHWKPERQFVFFENTLQVNTRISIYHDLEADRLAKPLVANGDNAPRLARSFLTFRYQPWKRLSLDVSHNYFRDVPTFDTRLIGTGLLDKFLFQGVSAGFRVSAAKRIDIYGNLGRSSRDTDTRSSLNYMGGLIFDRPLFIPFRTDVRYSRFNSSFGGGEYKTISFDRQMGDNLRFQFQAGQQNIKSSFTAQSSARFVNATADYMIGLHYLLGSGWTLYRGAVQNYDQVYVNLGYRFGK